MNEAKFLHHEPCPNCGSRDNVGVWEDGHKWCFGCGFHQGAIENINSLKKILLDDINKVQAEPDVLKLAAEGSPLTEDARRWLKKYELSDGEIANFGIHWNPEKQAITFPFYDKNKLVAIQYRYLSDTAQSKWKTYGHKKEFVNLIRNSNQPKHVVLVEDIISAIKVGRVVSCICLMGCTISDELFKYIIDNYEQVTLWLDGDKALNAFNFRTRFSQFVPKTRALITHIDPKEHDMETIHKFMNLG